MTKYTLVDLMTGEQWFIGGWERLHKRLKPNCILLRGTEHLGIILRRDLVLFARWCLTEETSRLITASDQSLTHVLALVDRWLEDERSVTHEELRVAKLAGLRTLRRTPGNEPACAVARVAWAVASTTEALVGAASAAKAGNAVVEDACIHRAIWSVSQAAEAAAEYHTSAEAQAQWLEEHLRSGK